MPFMRGQDVLDCWMLGDDDNQISSAQISHGS